MKTQTKIANCGCKIFDVKRFKGMYCYEYCCNHCPDAKNHPCQKEKIEGTFLTQLNKFKPIIKVN